MFAAPTAKTFAKPAANAAGYQAPTVLQRNALGSGSIGNKAMLALLARPAVPAIQPKCETDRPEDRWKGGTDRGAETTAAEASTSSEYIAPVRSGSELIVARQPTTETEPVNVGAAPAEREREVEAIKVGGMSYVLYQTKVRGGGSSAWLANNPGNMDYTADTVAWGCYEGKALPWGQHRFAIFQTEDLGLAAVRKFLRKYQTIRNITQMMNLFAPAGDVDNDPTKYSARVAARIGPPVTVNTLVKDLTDDQIQLFAEAIKDTEGWTPGPVNDVPRGDPSLPEGVRER